MLVPAVSLLVALVPLFTLFCCHDRIQPSSGGVRPGPLGNFFAYETASKHLILAMG